MQKLSRMQVVQLRVLSSLDFDHSRENININLVEIINIYLFIYYLK